MVEEATEDLREAAVDFEGAQGCEDGGCDAGLGGCLLEKKGERGRVGEGMEGEEVGELVDMGIGSAGGGGKPAKADQERESFWMRLLFRELGGGRGGSLGRE